MGQYCFARMASVVVCNTAGGWAGRVGGRVADTARRANRVTSCLYSLPCLYSATMKLLSKALRVARVKGIAQVLPAT